MEANDVVTLKPKETTTNVGNGCSTEVSEDGFTSASAILEIGKLKVIIRILKMDGATMLFICRNELEFLDEIGVAMPQRHNPNHISTTILGEPSSSSQCLAEKLSKRFKRQFYVSLNVGHMDPVDAPLFERVLSDYIGTHQKQFV